MYFTDQRDLNRSDWYPPADRARDTADFIAFSGLKYFEVEVRVVSMGENAIVCKDRSGIERIVRREDASFASWYIARDGIGRWLTLKVRKWI